jgi:nicotinamide mononucleotide (NMN) deamidase PncC
VALVALVSAAAAASIGAAAVTAGVQAGMSITGLSGGAGTSSSANIGVSIFSSFQILAATQNLQIELSPTYHSISTSLDW